MRCRTTSPQPISKQQNNKTKNKINNKIVKPVCKIKEALP